MKKIQFLADIRQASLLDAAKTLCACCANGQWPVKKAYAPAYRTGSFTAMPTTENCYVHEMSVTELCPARAIHEMIAFERPLVDPTSNYSAKHLMEQLLVGLEDGEDPDLDVLKNDLRLSVVWESYATVVIPADLQ